jgi:DNA topoisomerase-6 subunit B
VAGFLSSDFSRVSPNIAHEICKAAKALARYPPAKRARRSGRSALQGDSIDKNHGAPDQLHLAHRRARQFSTACTSKFKGDFYTAVTRPPAVYRGNPFVIEAGPGLRQRTLSRTARQKASRRTPLAEGEAQDDDNELARVIRLRQSRAASLSTVSLRNISRPCSRPVGAITVSLNPEARSPLGPMVIFVHMASVWVPFTSESKEAIAGL